jgi:hypothetical protein
MTTWLYQMSEKYWSPERYRFEIWEGEKWAWPVGKKALGENVPQAGDTVAFFFAHYGGSDPGFYGWAVVLDWYANSDTPLMFRPAAPSDHLKMHPWWNDEASQLADAIRGKMKQRTLWVVSDDLVDRLRQGVTAWMSHRHVDLE